MRELLILDEATVAHCATRQSMFDAVRHAFIALSQKDAELFPVSMGEGASEGSAIAIKSGLIRTNGRVGVKIGTYWPGNAAHGLPNHGATTLLLDPETGAPWALVNVRALNGLRTAAANAVATNALARKEASVLAIVGAGHQAAQDARAICDIRPIKKVLVWNRSHEKAKAFASALSSEVQVETVVVHKAEEAAEAADIISTATTATEPLLDWRCVQPGAHISAMGADRVGKMEWDAELLSRAKVFADHPPQAIEIGECQTAFNQGLVDLGAIVAIGDVLTGEHPGRQGDDEITFFDSSGVAVQDVAAASAVVESALAAGEATRIPF